MEYMKIKSSGRMVIVERIGGVFYVRHRNTVVSHVSGPYKADDKRFTRVWRKSLPYKGLRRSPPVAFPKSSWNSVDTNVNDWYNARGSVVQIMPGTALIDTPAVPNADKAHTCHLEHTMHLAWQLQILLRDPQAGDPKWVTQHSSDEFDTLTKLGEAGCQVYSMRIISTTGNAEFHLNWVDDPNDLDYAIPQWVSGPKE